MIYPYYDFLIPLKIAERVEPIPSIHDLSSLFSTVTDSTRAVLCPLRQKKYVVDIRYSENIDTKSMFRFQAHVSNLEYGSPTHIRLK